jgi:hypothetical protein
LEAQHFKKKREEAGSPFQLGTKHQLFIAKKNIQLLGRAVP